MVAVRSRIGSLLLALIGLVYLVGAGALLAWFVRQAWSAVGIKEMLLQFLLVVAGAVGGYFTTIAAQNLGLSLRAARARRTRAVTAS